MKIEAALVSNVWAPIGTTYHQLAIDTPAIAMSFCGLVVTEQSRYVVTPGAGIDAVPCVGEQCSMCRARSLHPGQLEVSS